MTHDQYGLQMEGLSQALGIVRFETRGKGLKDVSADLSDWLAEQRAEHGLLTLFLRHTSASLIVQENADPDVRADLVDALERLVPEDAGYRHAMEGPDDMPAHVKAALTATSLAIPVIGQRMMLGTWQAVYLAEHRTRPHRREIALHFSGTVRP